MKRLLAVLLAVALTTAAYAQQKVGPNGGLLAGKAGHETELVVSATELTVYLIDGGKAHSTKGASLRAVIQDAGKSTTVPLVDIENRKLVGKLSAPLGKGAIVVITGKDDHGDAVSARYTIN